MKRLEKMKEKIQTLLSRAQAHLKTPNDKVKEFESSCKRSGDGIEAMVFSSLLKNVYGVRIQPITEDV